MTDPMTAIREPTIEDILAAATPTELAEALVAFVRWTQQARIAALRLAVPNEPDQPGPYYDGWHAALDAVEALAFVSRSYGD